MPSLVLAHSIGEHITSIAAYRLTPAHLLSLRHGIALEDCIAMACGKSPCGLARFCHTVCGVAEPRRYIPTEFTCVRAFSVHVWLQW